MISGTCHCGAVRVEIPRKPQSVTNCNCSICRRFPAENRCGYYDFLQFERKHQTDPDFVALTDHWLSLTAMQQFCSMPSWSLSAPVSLDQ